MWSITKGKDLATWLARWDTEKPQEGFYLLERATDDAVSDVEADLVYDDRLPIGRVLELSDAGEVIELVDPFGCVVDTANADHSHRDGWAAGDGSTRATMERTDPRAEDIDEDWHTNLGLFTWGLDALGERLFGTARTENSPVLKELLLDLDYRVAEVHVGEVIRVGLPIPAGRTVSAEELRVVVSQPLREEVPVDPAIISTRRQGNVLELRIETSSFAPGEYHFWIRYGQRDVLFIPIELLK